MTEHFFPIADIAVTIDADDRTPEDLVNAIATLRDLIRNLRLLEDRATERLAKMAPHYTATIEGLGTVEVKRSANRTEWDHDLLWRHVSARARDERRIDEETGEILESEGETVARVLAACCRPSWRTTAVRALGLDPDEYCRVTPGPMKLVIR